MTHSKGENQPTKYDMINKIGKDIKTLLYLSSLLFRTLETSYNLLRHQK